MSLAAFLLTAVALLNLAIVGSVRLRTGIRLAAAEGLVLSLFPLAAHGGLAPRPLLLALGTAIIKGVAFPWLLGRTLRLKEVPEETEVFLGPAGSLLLGTGLLIAALFAGSRLPLPPGVANGSSLAVPVAAFGVLAGLLIIVSRQQAVSQVVGYLVLENGIFVFGIALVRDAPILVELGVLLDVFVAVLIMGITIFHIGRVLEHTDTSRLMALKE
jgi:hydrogenase-4 component E